MRSDALVDRYYYIYDSRKHRALVLEWAAGEERRADATPRAQLIDHVHEHRSSTVVRRFARWCARQVDAARLLVVHACTHPDAQPAALDAAHMSEQWAEFSAESDPESTARAMRTRHVDWLLDRLSAS